MDGVYAALAVNATGEFGSISPTYEEVDVLGQEVRVAPPVKAPPPKPWPPPGRVPLNVRVKLVKDLVVAVVTLPDVVDPPEGKDPVKLV